MTSAVELSIIIPLLNEEESLPVLHRELSETLVALGRSYEVIYVDDHSTDRSLEVLIGLRAEDASVRIVCFQRNFGQTAALAAGFEHSRGEVAASRSLESLGLLGAVPMRLVPEPASHVAEAVLIGHQFDSDIATARVEPAHILGRERRGLAPDGFVVAIRESVLGVELKLIDPAQRQQVHDAREGGARGNAVATHIEHVAAHGKIGPVADAQAGQRAAALPPDLPEEGLGVPKAAFVGVCDAHAFRYDIDLEARVYFKEKVNDDDGMFINSGYRRTACVDMYPPPEKP